MKQYRKEYEDVLSSERTLKIFTPEKISNDLGWTSTQYIEKYREFGKELYLNLFDLLVRMYWLISHFKYKWRNVNVLWNKERSFIGWSKFFVFCRNYIGIELWLMTRSFFPNRALTYFKDFFPLFMKDSPFENPDYYKFPYKNITPDFLFPVYQMPERLELLAYADERGMSYAKFVDYCINYALCYNDDVKKNLYSVINSKNFPLYIRYNIRNKMCRKNARKQLWRILSQ